MGSSWVRMWEAAERLAVDPTDIEVMEQLIRAGNTPQKAILRMCVVLRASEGIPNNQIAKELSVTRTTVLKWRERYIELGLEGILEDAPRSGRRRTITEEKEAEIVQATLTTKPADATQWSTRTMAAAQGVSDTTVYRIWNAHRLQPHRVETFKFSRDPRFAEKVRDILGLYMNPPDKALVLCVDEKSQIQALDRTQPLLPLRPNIPERQTHDYKRHGTTTLFAALNALDGTIVGQCQSRHRNQEFVRFLDKVDRTIPAGLDIHLVLDNYGTHTHANVQHWLGQHPRYRLHFTPTGASWVNLVERFFSEITERRIRRGTFRSVPELVVAITAYIKNRNRNPRPFVWTARASDIIRKVRRCAANSEAGH